ncbi:MAG: energy transducer TonB [Planctomycetes bacterium]|nr:energy transducer TonB [Planctomycetota bacterium]
MSTRTRQTRRSRPSLAVAISLALHACTLALLVHFAPIVASREFDPEPVSVRLVAHRPAAEQPLRPVRASDRETLPPLPASDVVQPITESLEELLAAAPLDGEPIESPAAAPHSVIGVRSSGSLLCSRLRSTALEARPAPSTPLAAGATAPDATCAVAVAIVPPAPLDCPAPEYPAGSASVGERGRVRLEIQIAADGRVQAVRVLGSSGYARLDEAARLCVERWRFRPALSAGTPVAWRLEHAIVFRVVEARG